MWKFVVSRLLKSGNVHTGGDADKSFLPGVLKVDLSIHVLCTTLPQMCHFYQIHRPKVLIHTVVVFVTHSYAIFANHSPNFPESPHCEQTRAINSDNAIFIEIDSY